MKLIMDGLVQRSRHFRPLLLLILSLILARNVAMAELVVRGPVAITGAPSAARLVGADQKGGLFFLDFHIGQKVRKIVVRYLNSNSHKAPQAIIDQASPSRGVQPSLLFGGEAGLIGLVQFKDVFRLPWLRKPHAYGVLTLTVYNHKGGVVAIGKTKAGAWGIESTTDPTSPELGFLARDVENGKRVSLTCRDGRILTHQTDLAGAQSSLSFISEGWGHELLLLEHTARGSFVSTRNLAFVKAIIWQPPFSETVNTYALRINPFEAIYAYPRGFGFGFFNPKLPINNGDKYLPGYALVRERAGQAEVKWLGMPPQLQPPEKSNLISSAIIGGQVLIDTSENKNRKFFLSDFQGGTWKPVTINGLDGADRMWLIQSGPDSAVIFATFKSGPAKLWRVGLK